MRAYPSKISLRHRSAIKQSPKSLGKRKKQLFVYYLFYLCIWFLVFLQFNKDFILTVHLRFVIIVSQCIPGDQPVICNLVLFLFLNIAVLGFIFGRPIGTFACPNFPALLASCQPVTNRRQRREAGAYARAYRFARVIKIQLFISAAI